MSADTEPTYHVLRTRLAREVRNCCKDDVVLTDLDVAFHKDAVELRCLHPSHPAQLRLTREEMRHLVTLFEEDEWET